MRRQLWRIHGGGEWIPLSFQALSRRMIKQIEVQHVWLLLTR